MNSIDGSPRVVFDTEGQDFIGNPFDGPVASLRDLKKQIRDLDEDDEVKEWNGVNEILQKASNGGFKEYRSKLLGLDFGDEDSEPAEEEEDPQNDEKFQQEEKDEVEIEVKADEPSYDNSGKTIEISVKSPDHFGDFERSPELTDSPENHRGFEEEKDDSIKHEESVLRFEEPKSMAELFGEEANLDKSKEKSVRMVNQNSKMHNMEAENEKEISQVKDNANESKVSVTLSKQGKRPQENSKVLDEKSQRSVMERPKIVDLSRAQALREEEPGKGNKPVSYPKKYWKKISVSGLILENMTQKTSYFTLPQWIKMMRTREVDNLPHSVLYTNLRMGIPHEIRPRIWNFLMRRRGGNQFFIKDESEFERLVSGPCPTLIEIEKDLERTHNEDEMFSRTGRISVLPSLRRVLIAVCNLDPEVGYIQGLNYIVAAIIYSLNQRFYEDKQLAFGTKLRNTELLTTNLTLYLLHVLGIRNMFLNEFPMIQSILDSFRLKLFHYQRKIFDLLKNNDVNIVEAFVQNFLCLLLYKIPLRYSTRILDMAFLEGDKFVSAVILRCLWLNEAAILELKEKETLFKFLNDNLIKCTIENLQFNYHFLFPSPENEAMYSKV